MTELRSSHVARGGADNGFALEPLEGRLMLSAHITVDGGPGTSIVVPNGDTTPSKTDHTDLGIVTLKSVDPTLTGEGTEAYNFSIGNSGDVVLNLNTVVANIVTISGANAGDFSVDTTNAPPATTVAAGSTTSFTLMFNPSAVGLRTATVTITSNDPSTPSYSFAIQGTGVPATLPGGIEDQNFNISYAMLNDAIQEGATPPSNTYILTSIDSGTLTINGAAANLLTLIHPNDALVWHPAANANHTLNAFTVKQYDTGTQASVGAAIPIRVEVTPVDDGPVGTIANVSGQQNGAPTVINLLNAIKDPDVTGTVVQFNTNLPQGSFYVNLFDQLDPLNVANFLSYVNSGKYNNTIVQRSIPGFIEQAGGYPAQYPPAHIAVNAAVANEYKLSNVRGTISMAKVGNNPNSATSEWFVNLADNSTNLDNQNDGFTAFGEIVGNGMTLWDAVAALSRFDGTTSTGDQSFKNLPLQNFDGSSLQSNNYVTITSAAKVNPVIYSILSNDNPDLVTPVISNGNLTLNYAAGHTGIANISIRATDLTGNFINTSFQVTVVPKPVAINDSAVARFGMAVSIPVIANDTPNTGTTLLPASVAIVAAAVHGTTVVDTTTGAVTYTPAPGFSGDDTFTYTVAGSDSTTSLPASVTVHVNAPPIAVNDFVTASPDLPLVIDVLANPNGLGDRDPDGTLVPGSVVIITAPTHGTTSINPTTGAVTYTANTGYLGSDFFTYKVTDNSGDSSNQGTVSINVIPYSVTIGDGQAAKSITFKDADGTTAKVTIASGDAALGFAGTGITQVINSSGIVLSGTNVRLTDVTLTNTNIKSTLAFTGSGGDGVINVDSISSLTPLLSISGKIVNIGTRVSIGASLVTLTLHDVTNAAITIGTSAATLTNVITLNNVTSSTLSTGMVIKSLTANSITGANSSVTAVALNAAAIKGDYQGALRLTGVASVPLTLGTFKAAGQIKAGNWDITGNAKTITADSTASGWVAAITGSLAGLTTTHDMAGRYTGSTLAALTAGGNLANLALTLSGSNTTSMTLGAVNAKGQIQGGTWQIIGDTKSITAASIVAGTGAWTATILGDIATVSVKGDAAGTLQGRSVKTFTVAGALKNALVTMTETPDPAQPKLLAVGTFTVKGLMQNTTLDSKGSIGTVAVGAMDTSNIYASVKSGRADPAALPSAGLGFDFVDQAVINSIKITGLKTQAVDMVASHIAGWVIKSVSALFAQAGTGDTISGVAAQTIVSLTYKDASGTTSLKKPAQFTGITHVGDLIINKIVGPDLPSN